MSSFISRLQQYGYTRIDTNIARLLEAKQHGEMLVNAAGLSAGAEEQLKKPVGRRMRTSTGKEGEMKTLLWKIHYSYTAFEREFGFEPTPALVDALIHEMEQRLVDSHLAALAENFNEVDRRERAVVFDCKGVENLEQLEAMKCRLAEARGSLSGAKVGFWHAYELAEKAGFVVREEYTDYLDLYQNLR